MRACCVPTGYDEFFSEKQARRDARRYRKRGLDKTARRMVEFLTARGFEDATVLDVGGGVGAIEIELLKAGAGRAVNVELSPSYEKEAAELLREAGLEERVERRIGDFARDGIEPADVVVLHRVVCCYPDYEGLVGAAADQARRALVLSFPKETWLTRSAFVAFNLVQRLRRKDFRAYVHPVVGILGAAERRGLRPAFEHRGAFWQAAGLERTSRTG